MDAAAVVSGKHGLVGEDNNALSAWQRRHLRVRWPVVEEPWRFELMSSGQWSRR
jgi:hypothetical protein